jgi:hypothetical protein
MNEIKLTGKIGFKKVITANSGKKFTTFSLGFYNGKDTEGKSKFGNVKTTFFGITDFNDADEVVVSGYLAQDSFTDKDGVARKNLAVIAKTIDKSDFKPSAHQEAKVQSNEFDDQSIPF